MSKNNNLVYPYSKPSINKNDMNNVFKVLKDGYLTQGTRLIRFEKKLKELFGSKYILACNSGTASLHLIYMALNAGPKKNILTTPLTFVATANAARMCGAKVYLSDVDQDTGLMDLKSAEKILKSNKNIHIISVVHLAGRLVDMEQISCLAKKYNCYVIEDACHAPGSSFKNSKNKEIFTGSCKYSIASSFSFHAIKHISTGEGGCVTTNNKELFEKIKLLRSHGLSKRRNNKWENYMLELGWNYRIDEISCALGLSQISRLKKGISKRRSLVKTYQKLLRNINYIKTPELPDYENSHVWHLFSVSIDFHKIKKSRIDVMRQLESFGIGTQIHYTPIFLQPYYKEKNSKKFSNALIYYNNTLSLPLYPDLNKKDVMLICDKLIEILEK